MYLQSLFPTVVDVVWSELEQCKQSEEVKCLKDAMVSVHVYIHCLTVHT